MRSSENSAAHYDLRKETRFYSSASPKKQKTRNPETLPRALPANGVSRCAEHCRETLKQTQAPHSVRSDGAAPMNRRALIEFYGE